MWFPLNYSLWSYLSIESLSVAYIQIASLLKCLLTMHERRKCSFLKMILLCFFQLPISRDTYQKVNLNSLSVVCINKAVTGGYNVCTVDSLLSFCYYLLCNHSIYQNSKLLASLFYIVVDTVHVALPKRPIKQFYITGLTKQTTGTNNLLS